MFLPSLDELRPQLDIPEINTGRRNLLTSACGISSDDLEGLHAVMYEDGRVRLSSGIEFYFYLFRGQPEEHAPCLPTLSRLRYIEERLLALCRNTAFEDAISDHPLVLLSEQIRFMNSPLHIDKQGLAQHYGLATDILDLTNNFDVASFFATCRWDDTSRCYRPVLFANEPGIIYRLTPAIYECSNINSAKLETIGWQPLKRPEQQRACGLRMKPGLDFCSLPSVQMIKFRHCSEVSNRIWQAFDEGRSLFPPDAAAELAEQAKVLIQFTRQQVDTAWEKLDCWDGETRDIDKRQQIEICAGINITASTTLSWHGLDVEHDETKLLGHLQEVMNGVRYRMAAYPES